MAPSRAPIAVLSGIVAIVLVVAGLFWAKQAFSSTKLNGGLTYQPACLPNPEAVRQRAKKKVNRAFDKRRWRDATPLEPTQRRTLILWLQCLPAKDREHVKEHWQRRKQGFFSERRYRKIISIPGAAYLRRLRYCESGSSGLYRTNTGNGFYGAYQFTLQAWRSVGGKGLPHQASPREQDIRAAILYRRSGSSPWPSCG